MATIAFISLYDRNAHGARMMSAALKRAGHRCALIFLKRYDTRKNYRLTLEADEYPWIGINKRGRAFKYATHSIISDHELELLRQTLASIAPSLIGMTVNTPLRAQNNRVATYLRRHLDVPIVWGGYDPTVNTRDCLTLCDYACVGEGDRTVLDLADRIDAGRALSGAVNLAWLEDGAMRTSPRAPLDHDLDRLPWRDDSCDDKYFIDDGRVIADYPVVNDKEPGVYQAMSARGCPYKCSYCCEATFKDLYSGEMFLRRRSPEDFVAELANAKQRFGLTRLMFEDEIFAMNVKWLKVFVPLYREQVGLPFTAYIYPCRTIEEILGLLKSAGLEYCCLALESGSEHINRAVYDRVYDRDLFLKTAAVCRALSIEFYTDVITYSPYEQEPDLRGTLDVLTSIGGTFDLCINKLFVLPGTRLADTMARDGVAVGDASRDLLFDYYCRLFWIASFTPHARRVIGAIQRMPWFRRWPFLLDPALLEIALTPLASARRGWQASRSAAQRWWRSPAPSAQASRAS